jgi:CBS domain-containing protein
MKVMEIMTASVSPAGPDTTLEQIATLMRNEDVGSVPIVEDDELIGIVTDRDIVVRCIAEGGDPSEVCAEDILTDDLEVVSPDSDVDEAAELMSRRQVRRLPVVDKGRLIGMISLGDIAVKQNDDNTSGEALERVSQGVKPSNPKSRQPQKKTAQRQADIRAPRSVGTQGKDQGRRGQLHKSEAEQGRAVRGAGRKIRATSTRENRADEQQGITNRSVREEDTRQARVVPFRAEAKGAKRIRAEAKGAKRTSKKAG